MPPKLSRSNDLQNYFIMMSKGVIEGYSSIRKFGRNPNISTTAIEAIWSGGGNYNYISAAATLYISSSDAGDTQDILVQGLDANYDLQEQTVTLQGQTKTEIGSGLTWIRVYRAYNDGTTNLAGDVYVYEDDTVTNGVPDTATKIVAIIENPDTTGLTHNQTLMAIYTIPAGYNGYIMEYNGNTGNGKDATLYLQTREFGKVFRTRSMLGVFQNSVSRRYTGPPIKLTEKTDIQIVGISTVAATLVNCWFDLVLEEMN